MDEIIGLLLLGATFALIALITPWFRRHEHSRALDRWMVAEMTAVSLVGMGAIGASFVIAALIESWQSGDTTQIALTYGGAVVVLPALVIGSRWLGRVVARKAGRGTVPKGLASAG